MKIFFALKGSKLFYSYLENNGKIWLCTHIHSHGAATHDGMQVRVQHDGEYSEPFPVTNWSNKAVLWHKHCSA